MSLVLTQNVLIIEASASKENHSTLSDGGRGVGITWSGGFMEHFPGEKPLQLNPGG